MKLNSRREFLTTTFAGAAALGVAGKSPSFFASPRSAGALAIQGGSPIRTTPFTSWPIIAENDEKNWHDILWHKQWCRWSAKPSSVLQFEEAWKSMTGAKYCLATASGTTALITSLNALDINPGDEVIVPPYTMVATIDAVLLQHALPVFVDTDRETFQIDANKIEAAVTSQTRCILPVHLGGSPANIDEILEVARKHNVPVVEDCCQAHLAEWRHQKVGTLGALGCFSFQGSKNLNSGEGGAVLTNQQELIERCMSFHNHGRVVPPTGYWGTPMIGEGVKFVMIGTNCRMPEFQGALLLAQATRLEAQSRTRTENATYLTKLLREIPGITPARMYDGCTRNAYHLYMLRYDQEHFSGLPRARFVKCLKAEGIPCHEGYRPLNKEPVIEVMLNSRGFKRIYTEQELANYRERVHCPENDRLCDEEAVWMFQTMFLGTHTDMDQIAEAIRKIQKSAGELTRS